MNKWIVAIIISFNMFFGISANAAEEGAFEKLAAACGEQIEAVCPGIVLGHGRILKCLEEKQAELSEECNKARIAAQEQLNSVKEEDESGSQVL